jgi:hypothetical protein
MFSTECKFLFSSEEIKFMFFFEEKNKQNSIECNPPLKQKYINNEALNDL